MTWLNLLFLANWANCDEENRGPLSDNTIWGIPCLAKIDFRWLIMLPEVVDVNFTISKYLE